MGEVVVLPIDLLDNPDLRPKSFTHAEVVMFWCAARDALDGGTRDDLEWALRFLAEAMVRSENNTRSQDKEAKT